MSEARYTTMLVVLLFMGLVATVFILTGASPQDAACLRVIIKLPVDPAWQLHAKAMPHESGLCHIAERIDGLRHAN